MNRGHFPDWMIRKDPAGCQKVQARLVAEAGLMSRTVAGFSPWCFECSWFLAGGAGFQPAAASLATAEPREAGTGPRVFNPCHQSSGSCPGVVQRNPREGRPLCWRNTAGVMIALPWFGAGGEPVTQDGRPVGSRPGFAADGYAVAAAARQGVAA